MKSKDIRNLWIKFFESKGCKLFNSASLIPKGDKSLLWINAGVTPLKKFFDGSEIPFSKRLVSIQKCIRTNDIENVGKTARHHTFFEMLGNFSVGDYFKKEAIEWAFEILTSKEYFNFPLDKLYMTYYPNDLDAYNFWLKQGVKKDHLIKNKANFWEIGKGPSGPCSEIWYDRGTSFDKRGKELIEKDLENDRFIEIWNIVFSQFNADPNLKREEYQELPHKNIDTGAGLERFACILQNVKTNFETDLFTPIMDKISEIAKVKYTGQMEFKIIADHIKTIVMALFDGAKFSNDGRGYVLRRLLRRAMKSGLKLKINDLFLFKLVDSVYNVMHEFYNLNNDNKKQIELMIKDEEERFKINLSKGLSIIEKIKNDKGKISGLDAFILFDTYGFPIDLTKEYAEENNLKIDLKGFENELKKAQERSRKNQKDNNSFENQNETYLNFTESSIFDYNLNEVKAKVILALKEGIVLDKTCCYAESGGQISDSAFINNHEVLDIKKMPNGQHLHLLKSHNFKLGDEVLVKIDQDKRAKIRKNHTATHLLQKALKDILGNHIQQQGSKVSENFLRFDFNHYKEITEAEILKIESIINQKIKASLPVKTNIMKLEEAKKLDAMQLFEEKYGEIVRVVDIDSYSVELCGGTHVLNTKEINKFAISSISSIGSGLYRIIAFTNNPEKLIEKDLEKITLEINKIKPKDKKDNLPKILGSYQDYLNYKKYLNNLKEETKLLNKKETEKQSKELKNKIIKLISKDNLNQLIILENSNLNEIKIAIDEIFNEFNLNNLIILNKINDKFLYLIKSKNDAKNLSIKLNNLLNGKGGGNLTFAQGSGNYLKITKEEIFNDISWS